LGEAKTGAVYYRKGNINEQVVNDSLHNRFGRSLTLPLYIHIQYFPSLFQKGVADATLEVALLRSTRGRGEVNHPASNVSASPCLMSPRLRVSPSPCLLQSSVCVCCLPYLPRQPLMSDFSR
jgi:hypothetical protein